MVQYMSKSLLRIGCLILLLSGILLLQPWGEPYEQLAAEPNPTFDCNTVSQISQTECNALLQLHAGMGGANWTKNTNWLATNQPCDWYGVTCTNDRVTALGFKENNLQGSIPSAIGQLTYLERIGFHFNNLQGTIPSSLYTLSNLTIIRLDHNQLSGTISPQFAQLRDLARLNLSINQFNGTIPPELSTLSSLEQLVLGGNDLTGTIPSELTNLTQLTKFYLGSTQLSGELPATIGNLTNLQELYIPYTQLSGEIPASITALTQLIADPTKTNIGHNRFWSNNASVLAFLATKQSDWQSTQTVPPTNLQAEPLSTNTILLTFSPIAYSADGGYYEVSYQPNGNSSFIVHGVTPNKSATSYTLDNLQPATAYTIRLRTFTPAHTYQPSSLWSVYSEETSATTKQESGFSCDNVTGIPTTECTALVSFFNSTNGTAWNTKTDWLVTNTPCTWHGIVCHETGGVSEIVLPENNLSGSFPTVVTAFSQLTNLRLDRNNLSGLLPTELSSLTSLEKLNLGNNSFAGGIPDSWGALTNLRNLVINKNKLRGTVPATFQGLTKLERLYAGMNQLAGAFPKVLCGLTQLQELTIGNNQLEGAMPECVTNLTQLTAGGGVGFGNNMLWTTNPSVRNFLDSKDPSWSETQTIVPANFAVESKQPTQITVKWEPIPYQADGGYYELTYATSASGQYQIAGQTADKSTSTFTIRNLNSDTTYYIRIRTHTPSHGNQQSDLYTPYSDPISAKTDPLPFGCNLVTEISQTECNALMALYENTGGTQWDTKTDWGVTFTPCSWYGVLCSNGRVIQLDLAANQLSGLLPAALGDLTALKILQLSDNDLIGAIPSQLGSLTALQRLFLQRNRFSDTIPTTLGNLSQLQVLYLSHNQLSGSFPNAITTLINLNTLHLQDNRLEGTIPAAICERSGLVDLNLAANRWENSLPTCLKDLTALGTLDISYNRFNPSEPTLIAFLDSKSPGWHNTQTVPPTNLVIREHSANEVRLLLAPINYTGDGGYYEISIDTSVNGSFSTIYKTANKSTNSYVIPNLTSNIEYFVRVRTYTPAHQNQGNELWSDYITTSFGIPFGQSSPTPTFTPSPTPTTPTPPTDTTTVTATPTRPTTNDPTATVTPTYTPGPQLNFLPVIAKARPTDTPIPPTVTPTSTPTDTPPPVPIWRRVGQVMNASAITVHKGNLFAGSRDNFDQGGGLYQRPLQNCALSPDFTRQGFPQTPVFDVIFQGNNGALAAFGDGLFFTDNNGASWQKTGDDVGRPRTVAIAGGNVFYTGAETEGLYISNNGGRNWIRQNEQLQLINVITLQSSTLWIGTENGVSILAIGSTAPLPINGGLVSTASRQVYDFVFVGNGAIYLATYDGVYRGDGTTDWQPFGLQGKELLSLEVMGNALYAGLSRNAGGNRGVWRRDLAGGDWIKITPADWGTQGYSVRALMHEPQCGGLLAATSDGIWIYR